MGDSISEGVVESYVKRKLTVIFREAYCRYVGNMLKFFMKELIAYRIFSCVQSRESMLKLTRL